MYILPFLTLSISSAFMSCGPKIANISNVPQFILKIDWYKPSLNGVNEGENYGNPSTAFGKPLNEDLKKSTS